MLHQTLQQILNLKPDGSLGDALVDPLVRRALALVDGTSSEDEEARALFIEIYFVAFPDVEAARALLLAPLSDDLAERAAQQQARLASVCEPGLAYLRDFQSRSLIKQILSQALRLDPAMLVVLLEDRPQQQAALRAQSDASQPAMADCLALQVGEGHPGRRKRTDRAGAARPLAASAPVQSGAAGRRLAAQCGRSRYISAHAADFAGFDLNLLPLDLGAFTPGLFAQWRRLCDYRTLRDSLPSAEQPLLQVFEMAAASQGTTTLSEELLALVLAVAGWDRAALKALVGAAPGFSLNDAHFRDERWLLRLQACLALSERLRSRSRSCSPGPTNDPDALQATEVLSAIKAKYEDEQWLAIGKALNDPLRDRQREALVAYLLALPALHEAAQQAGIAIQTASDLHLLSGRCRDDLVYAKHRGIKRAISAVQLFIQRWPDEPGASGGPESQINLAQWKWMQNYRVWECQP